jgi:hypothetical protein
MTTEGGRMTLVVLAAHASAVSRSIVHSHQDSFGHGLELVGPSAVVPGRLDVMCECGWRGLIPAADVDPSGLHDGPELARSA